MDLLAGADAMRSINLDRRGALWQSKGLAEAALPLFAHLHEYGPEADPALPEMPLGEHVVHDYSTMRLSLKAHPLSFFRQELQRRRFVTASDLATAANGRMLDLAGLVLVRQKPGTAKGVLFVTLEDETGSANLIVWPKVFERFRRTVLGAKLLHVRGQLQREGQVIHIIARSLADMTGRLPELSGADGHDTPSFSNPWAHADEVRAPAEDPRAIADQKTGRTDKPDCRRLWQWPQFSLKPRLIMTSHRLISPVTQIRLVESCYREDNLKMCIGHGLVDRHARRGA